MADRDTPMVVKLKLYRGTIAYDNIPIGGKPRDPDKPIRNHQKEWTDKRRALREQRKVEYDAARIHSENAGNDIRSPGDGMQAGLETG